MGLHIDTHQITELGIDLRDAPGRLQRNSDSVLRGFARKIQLGMRKDASGHRFLPKLAATVGVTRLGPAHYEIGFDKVGQGKLANIIVFGSINNAPVFSHTAALVREEPRMVQQLADMAAKESVTHEGA